MDWITLDTFRLDCILGVLAREQVTPQSLLVTVRMAVPLDKAADDDDLAATVNYADVMEDAAFLFETGHFRLLETMAVAFSRWLLADPLPIEGRAPISAVEITLRKPEVLHGRAIPGISVVRDRAWLDPRRERWAPRIVAENLQRNATVRSDRLVLHGGWAMPAGSTARLVAGSASVDGIPIPVGTRVLGGALHSDGASVWLVIQRTV